MDKKHYLVYKTTNLVNGKIYIGKHETDNLDDGYLGSGNLLRRAIEKYGRENFKREILFECSTREEMNLKEAELVNEEFLKRNDIYNIKLGGQGGFDFINSTGINNSGNNASKGGKTHSKLMKEDPIYREHYASEDSERMKRMWKEHPELFKNFRCDWTGRHHTIEAKSKISKAMKQRTGALNNAWGTKWMHNNRLKRTLRVKKENIQSYLDLGWEFGAVWEWIPKK